MKKRNELEVDLFCSGEELRLKLNEQKRQKELLQKQKELLSEFDSKYPTFEKYHKECISIDFHKIIPKWTNDCREFWQNKRSVEEFHFHFLQMPFDF